ncbi:hypothetical protein NDU88_003555 [Pleurodeles waltl]|uniref:Uncharacterized protein n=1 Tax=Pleurodeles waltl TaxID=8319 RepID=A0AAV7W533_PLEWA|nr:hypothetical protein NDU88_003555 [Pleurodeles waltl]
MTAPRTGGWSRLEDTVCQQAVTQLCVALLLGTQQVLRGFEFATRDKVIHYGKYIIRCDHLVSSNHFKQLSAQAEY